MADNETLSVELSVKDKEYLDALKGAVNALDKASGEMSKATSSLAKTTEKDTGLMTQAFATMAGFVGGAAITKAFSAAADAAKFLFDTLVVDGVQAAIETESAFNRLTNSLARNGNLLPGVADDMKRLAEEIEKNSRFTDDAALSAASLLENITQLDSQGLQQATRATADLASAMGMDLETAASLVGKAINGNTDSLKRYGIEITKSADGSQNFANVIGTLNARFGGSAASEIQTYEGSIGILGKAWEDVTKAIGNAIIQNKTVIAAVQGVSNMVAQFGDFLTENSKEIRIFFGELVQGALNAAGVVVSAFQSIATVADVVKAAFKIAGENIAAVAAAVVQAASGDFSAAADTMKTAFSDLKQNLSEIGENPGLTKLSDALAEVKGNVDIAFRATEEGATAVVEPLNKAAGAAKALTDAQKDALAFANELVNQKTPEQQDANKLALLEAEHEAELISDQEFFATKEQMLLDRYAREQELLDQALLTKQFSAEQYAAANLAIEQRTQAESLKLMDQRIKAEQAANNKKLDQAQTFFGNFATLSQTGNKDLAAIGKAAAITQATIAGYQAVQNALAVPPYPVGVALAVSAGVAAAANVAKIASTPLATGIDSVPGMGSGDNFPAMLAPGERVVPSKTNEDLTAFLREQSSQPRVQNTFQITLNDVFTTDPVVLGTRIIEYANEAMQRTGVKMLGSTV